MGADEKESGCGSSYGPGAPDDNDIVVELVEDPAAPPDHIVLQGYPGDSTDEGVLRLYLLLDFSAWVELDRNDVKFHASPGQPQYPTVIWIRRTADIDYYERKTQRHMPAQYLDGLICRPKDRVEGVASGYTAIVPYWCSHL
jgi:hypothetical protein